MVTVEAKTTVLGVLGGSGVYQMEGVEIVAEHDITTPYGKPSDVIVEASIHDRSVFFLPRHGKGHVYTPTEVPYQANIYALKKLGVTHLLAVSAVGIMREEIQPSEIVVPNQIFDRTKGVRKSSFFEKGIVGHVAFADPFCEEFRSVVIEASKNSGANKVHDSGTYVCMEGPAFSTRSESHFYRKTMNPSVIGMTAIPEAKLAREAEICYAMAAMATDYDCWHESEEDVSVDAVLEVLKNNSQTAKNIVKQVAKIIPETSTSYVLNAAQYSILTNPETLAPEVKERLNLLYGKYWN